MDTKRQAASRALSIERGSRRSAILFAAIGATAFVTLWLVASTPARDKRRSGTRRRRRERNGDEDHYRCRLTRGVQIQALQGDRSQGRRHVRCQEQRPPAPRLQDRRQEDQASQARPEPDHEGHVQEEGLVPVPLHGQRPCRRRHEGHVPRQVTAASNQARAPGPSWRPSSGRMGCRCGRAVLGFGTVTYRPRLRSARDTQRVVLGAGPASSQDDDQGAGFPGNSSKFVSSCIRGHRSDSTSLHGPCEDARRIRSTRGTDTATAARCSSTAQRSH